jgi:hypothetical protein
MRQFDALDARGQLEVREVHGVAVDVQRADGLLVADATDRLAEQRRDRKLADAPAGWLAAGDSGMVSVTTSSSSASSRCCSTALPDSTGCVM